MYDRWEHFQEFIKRLVYRLPSRPEPQRPQLQVEALEERWCPAGTWEWINNGTQANTNWSNGNNWQVDTGTGYAAAPANSYPGKAGSVGDKVIFDLAAFGGAATGPATLDVALGNPINSLEITGWGGKTLTLSNDLVVEGDGYTGDFQLTDGSDISLAAGKELLLQDLPGTNTWSAGFILCPLAGATVVVAGSQLDITGAPGTLEPDMVIEQSVATGHGGTVDLDNMTGDLVLNRPTNAITVYTGSNLNLDQEITVDGTENTIGGISLGAGHNMNDPAVVIESGGLLQRFGDPTEGVIDEVTIGGAVYNEGGTVQIYEGAKLLIAGQDSNGYSYWQDTSVSSVLSVTDSASSIQAVGTYQIDQGAVQLTAPISGSADELDGAGLDFANTYDTFLLINDSTPGTQGNIIITGSVDLGTYTQTTMNFTGATNTSDLLTVESGTLTLNGTLTLVASDRQASSQPLNLFENNTAHPSIIPSPKENRL